MKIQIECTLLHISEPRNWTPPRGEPKTLYDVLFFDGEETFKVTSMDMNKYNSLTARLETKKVTDVYEFNLKENRFQKNAFDIKF